jgi:hypothetical protein
MNEAIIQNLEGILAMLKADGAMGGNAMPDETPLPAWNDRVVRARVTNRPNLFDREAVSEEAGIGAEKAAMPGPDLSYMDQEQPPLDQWGVEQGPEFQQFY